MIVIFLQNSYFETPFLKALFFWYNVEKQLKERLWNHYLKPSIPALVLLASMPSLGKYPAIHRRAFWNELLCAPDQWPGWSLVFWSASAYLSGDSINSPAQSLDWGLLLAPSDTRHQSTGWRQPLSPPIFYDRDKASFQPHYLKIFSLRYQIETQLTPTCYGASIRLKQKQGKALSLYLHATDELTVEQVDKRTLALLQEGKTETNKNSLTMFTALQMNLDILAISQKLGTGELT